MMFSLCAKMMMLLDIYYAVVLYLYVIISMVLYSCIDVEYWILLNPQEIGFPLCLAVLRRPVGPVEGLQCESQCTMGPAPSVLLPTPTTRSGELPPRALGRQVPWGLVSAYSIWGARMVSNLAQRLATPAVAVFTLLNELKIPAILIGGAAGNLNGTSRSTKVRLAYT